AASRPVKGYSGGMRRRLDLAASLVAAPPVLFLDEPTTGLDPRSRLALWDVIRERVAGGTTVLLTTQYLEEADRLANRIAVIDRGRVIASGTADELKARVGGEHFELTVARDGGFEAARRIVRRFGNAEPYVEPELRYLKAPMPAGTELLPELVQALQGEGVRIEDLGLRRPTLDDVFLALTD